MILVALAGLAAVSWYTNAGGEVRWAFSSAAPPAVGESQVVPASFLQPVGKERDKLVSTSSLELRVRDSATGSIKSGKDALALNGDHDESGFQIALKDFLAGHPSAKGGRLELRSGSLPLRLHDVPTGDYVLLPDETPVNAFAIKLPLAELKDQGEKDVIAYWTPQDDKVGDLDALSYRSNPIKVKIDTVGPVLRQVRLSGDLKQGPEVILEFESSDFDAATVKVKNFSVQRALEDGRFEVEREIADATIDKTDPKVIRLKFAVLDPGVYRVRVLGTKASGTADSQVPLRDSVGNHAGGSGTRGLNQERIFGASPAPEPGKQVEFAEFQPTLPQPQFARRINPADKVVTEVVRLYYYRDAHRVAQLINRTAESLNRAAVDLARRRAEDARFSADDATDQRRSSEREAVRRAEELRRAEHEAAQARQDLTAAQQDQQRLQDRQAALQRQIDDFQARFPNFQADYSAAAAADRQAELNLWQANDALANQQQKIRAKFEAIQNLQAALAQQPADHPDARGWRQQLDAAHAELARLQADETTLTNDRDARQAARNLAAQRLEPLTAQKAVIDKLTSDKSAMDAATASASAQASGQRQLVVNKEGTLANLRSTAAMANETAITAQAKEDRAREQQFRLEVSAAHEDPDTYAPAKLDSVDPVAQVSVQVIGEGLIQLRGPQKGVNKIKTAINQIDAPVGQVKVEVVTVQLNGERGNRMEAPLGRVEAHLGLGRFLTAQSLMLLRQAIQEEATRIAQEQEQGGRYQIDRDRKYLYGFFGQDFIDELYEMDSEFLHTENKLLSLHSMDTISLHQALFIMALAKNDVRQMILANFMAKVRAELVQAEFDYRCSSELAPFKTRTFFFPSDPRCKKQTHWYQVVAENNQLRYNFRNLQTFYATLDTSAGDAMNPVQREFIRLAQIFKARLVTELELKQRVIERAMIEDDRERNLLEEEQAEASIRPQVLDLTREVRQQEFKASDQLVASLQAAQELFANVELQVKYADAVLDLEPMFQQQLREIGSSIRARGPLDTSALESSLQKARAAQERILELKPLTAAARSAYPQTLDLLQSPRERLDKQLNEAALVEIQRAIVTMRDNVSKARQAELDALRTIRSSFQAFAQAADVRRFDWEATVRAYRELDELLAGCEQDAVAKLRDSALAAYDQASALHLAKSRAGNARSYLQQTRSSLDRRKLLDFLIEEQEYKYIDLLEGVRAQIASMDNHLKRLSIALEDDFKLQFYDPAFVRIRDAAREWEVTLGQVERTSILTNNRAFAKVMPQATMEFDLPKRKIAVAEAFDSAKALVDDYGALLNDPTFLAAYQIMGGKASNGKVQNVLPGLPSQTDEQQMGFSSPFAGPPGSSLQALVPDPSVYKFETGTGFEIRPVIQPDGNSIVYDFNYMYTTEIREPVRADEKHLGRIKRHFINTQVQTSSFELREISRYQVALKAARTSQGVPLLQDIPIAGLAFRPLPSAESSIQQNVILGSSVVYPTLFDLMGLRWAPSVVDLNHISVRDAEHVVRGRRWSIESSVFQQSSEYVDRLLGIEYDTPQQYRPDLYHRHWEPSPYHPSGHTFPGRRPDDDPTGEGYEQPDRRPQEFREPPYDRRFRRPTMYETIPNQGPRFDSGTVPAPIPELRLPDGPSAADSMSLPSPEGPLPALGRP